MRTYISFGRYQPLTVGHAHHILKMVEEAKRNEAKCIVYVSKTQNSVSDPLTPDDKVLFVRKIVGDSADVDIGSNPFEVASRVAKSSKHITYFAGGDYFSDPVEFSMFNRLQRYGEGLGTTIDITGTGERTDGISGTDMRNAAANGNFLLFMALAPIGLGDFSENDAERMYDMVRAGMGYTDRRSYK